MTIRPVSNAKDVREALMRTELKALSTEQVDMDKYRSYFDGKQALVYTTALFKRVFGDAFEGFKDNWMKVIVNATNNRLELINFHFDLSDDEDEDELNKEDLDKASKKLAKRIWNVLRLNEFNVNQRDLHEGAMVEGRAFVIVWPDKDKGATVDWQPGQLCRVFYDPDERNKALWAVKRWSVEGGEIFVTFYKPDFVYKFVDTSRRNKLNEKASSSSALSEVADIGLFPNLDKREVEGEAWPLPNPYGKIPVIEFNNTSFASDLEGAIPQQDALNKTLLDMMLTGEFQAFPHRILETNSSAPVDGWQVGPGQIMTIKPSTTPEGQHIPLGVHTFPAADPSTYMEPIGMWLQHMALTNSTPVRFFMKSDRGGRGDAESGEALLVDDKPLNDKVEEKQKRFGNRHLEVARFIAHSLGVSDPFSLVGEAVWQDPRHDYRLSKLKEGLTMIEIGIPIEFVVQHLGFTPDETVELLAMIEKQKLELEAKEKAELDVANANTNVNDTPVSGSDSGTSATN